jgi:hypothetical protein
MNNYTITNHNGIDKESRNMSEKKVWFITLTSGDTAATA